MMLYISHSSALEYWRNNWRRVQAGNALAEKRKFTGKPSAEPLDASELRFANPWGLSMPLHILVGSKNARKTTRGLICHISSGQLPQGSFVQVSSGLAVSSPELCFVQLANKLTLVELVELGYEMCGVYRLEGQGGTAGGSGTGRGGGTAGRSGIAGGGGTAGHSGIAGGGGIAGRSGNTGESSTSNGFRNGPPLTSKASLGSYIAKATGQRGRAKALRALRFIAEGSASPMETILAMMLTLPYRLGGYGFSIPLHNKRINVPAGTGKKAEWKELRCDLYWLDAKVGVEYDSDAFHTLAEKITKDAIRRNALSSVRTIVITVTKRQIVSEVELRKVAHVLSKLLGKRLQQRMPEFAERHAALRRQLLPKVSFDR